MKRLLFLLCWRIVSGRIGTDGVCNIIAILPFTNYGLDHSSVHWDITKVNDTVTKKNNNVGYSHFATLEMAIRHFNERNSIVVSELANIDSCNVTMVSVKYIDSQSGGHSAAERLLSYLLYASASNPKSSICAIIGPSEEVPINEVSTIARTFDIPTIAYGGMSMRLVNSRYHPYTTRTSSDANSMAYAIIDYIVRVHNRTNYIAILYPQQTEDNIQQHELMARYIEEYNITNTLSLSFEAMSNGEQVSIASIEDACRQIKLSGYQTIITIFSNPNDELPFLTQSAKNHGLLNGDYFWILTGEATQFSAFQNFSHVDYQSMTNLLTGAAFVTALDNPIGKSNNNNSNNDGSFHVAWKSQGDDVVNRINQLYPIQVSTDSGYYKGQSNYFQDLNPVDGTGYLYDAVMTVGLGACQMTKTTTTTTETRNSRRVSDTSIRYNSSILTSIQHFRGIRDTIFQGSSGIVSFGDDTDLFPGSRVVSGLTYGAYTFGGEFPKETTNNASTRTGKDLFRLTHTLLPNSSTWITINSFYYADGTLNAPLLRSNPDYHFLSNTVRVIGFVLLGIGMVYCLANVLWITCNSTHRILILSQPPLLLQLCFGSMMLLATILPISFDENSGLSIQQLSISCKLIPWLVVIGQIIQYMALFTKLWRVHRILQFQRVRIDLYQEAWPTIGLATLASIFLIVWSVTSGNVWIRTVIDKETGESIGFCNYTGNSGYWLLACLPLILTPTVIVTKMAWSTRDIDSTYSESSWILRAVCSQWQILLISIPVLVILMKASTNGRHMGMCLLIFTYTISFLCFIMFPKYVAFWKSRNTEDENSAKRGSRGSRGGVQVSGISIVSSMNGDFARRGSGDTAPWVRAKSTRIIDAPRQESMRMTKVPSRPKSIDDFDVAFHSEKTQQGLDSNLFTL